MAVLSDISDRLPASSKIVGASAGVFVAIYAIWTFLAWYRLRHIKGPFVASLTKLWLLRAVMSGHMHQYYWDVNKKYGSIARIGPNDIVTSDADFMRRMLGTKSHYRRSDWYIGMRFDPGKDNIESLRDDAMHNALRAKMSGGYSGREVEGLELKIDANVTKFIRLVEKYLPYGPEYKPFDFARKTQFFTLDVISSLAYSDPFGFIEEDRDVHRYIEMVEKVIPSFLIITVYPWLMSVFEAKVMKAALPSETDPLGWGKILGIVSSVVETRFSSDAKHQQDMLGSWKKHGMTRDEIKSEIIVQILAGSDTTAIAIQVIFYHLITNPRILDKFRAEIAEHKLTSPVTDKQARQMPYLQAIIKEGLRIRPPVVGLMSKEAPPEGDIVNGVFIPGGTRIGYGAFGIFRNRRVFGEDADVFRPERWLDAPPERLKQMEADWELIFARGRWMCLGRDVAMMELNKVFIELLMRFDFTVVNHFNPFKSVCNGIFQQSDMFLTASRRPDGWTWWR